MAKEGVKLVSVTNYFKFGACSFLHIFLNNQTFPSLFSKLNWLFLLIIEIFSYICTCYPKGEQDIYGCTFIMN